MEPTLSPYDYKDLTDPQLQKSLQKKLGAKQAIIISFSDDGDMEVYCSQIDTMVAHKVLSQLGTNIDDDEYEAYGTE